MWKYTACRRGMKSLLMRSQCLVLQKVHTLIYEYLVRLQIRPS